MPNNIFSMFIPMRNSFFDSTLKNNIYKNIYLLHLYFEFKKERKIESLRKKQILFEFFYSL